MPEVGFHEKGVVVAIHSGLVLARREAERL
jgi:hypothetical protein